MEVLERGLLLARRRRGLDGDDQRTQQGDAGTDKHGTLTHSSRRRAVDPSMGFDP